MSKNEIYFSTDVETDGPIPGPNSMLSMGSAAFTAEGKLLGTFSANLDLLPGASGDPSTMDWWKTQPKAWAEARKDPRNPAEVMSDFTGWVESFSGSPVFVGYPATFDFMFVYWYLIYFTKRSPFSFSALDIKSFTMAELQSNFRESTKKNMPRRWFKATNKHSHVAVEDAIEQGQLFTAILSENRRRGLPSGR